MRASSCTSCSFLDFDFFPFDFRRGLGEGTNGLLFRTAHSISIILFIRLAHGKACKATDGKQEGKKSEIFLFSGYFTKENLDNENYPPLFELDVMRNVALCFPVKVQSYL
jgi:hypothetical protein